MPPAIRWSKSLFRGSRRRWSFRRKPESSLDKFPWTPAFAGVTDQVYSVSRPRELILDTSRQGQAFAARWGVGLHAARAHGEPYGGTNVRHEPQA